MTSAPNVLTTELRDLLYNPCIDNTGFFFFSIFSSPEPKASSVRCPHSLNIFSETTGPIEAKFHMESPWDGGTKVCSNGPGHMTKIAAMPISGKNL